MVPDPIAAFFYQDVILVIDAYHLLHLRAFFCQGEGQRLGRDRRCELGIVEIDVRVEAIDPVGLVVVPVITQFVRDIQDDQQTDTEAGSEADDVEGGKPLLFLRLRKAILR